MNLRRCYCQFDRTNGALLTDLAVDPISVIEVIPRVKTEVLRHVSGGFRVHILMEEGESKKIQAPIILVRLLEAGECVSEAVG